MAQDITIAGATFNSVPSIVVPTANNGSAIFVDPSPTTAVAADVASSKYFFDSLGNLTQGTASGGGGGGSNWTLLASKEFTVNSPSTSAASVGTIDLTLADYNDPEVVVWVHIRDKAGKRAGYFYGTDSIFIQYTLANNNTSSLGVRPMLLIRYTSSNAYNANVNVYGIYAHTLYYTESEHYISIYSRASSSNAGTINGTYKCDVYKLTTPNGMTLFT